MKPSWDDAPAEAMWLAMDGDGWWNWFEVEPKWNGEPDNMWLLGDDRTVYWDAESGRDESGIDWDFAYSTLEPRP